MCADFEASLILQCEESMCVHPFRGLGLEDKGMRFCGGGGKKRGGEGEGGGGVAYLVSFL